MDQTLILVDQDDRPTGYASRAACHDGEGLLHRAIAVAVFDSAGNVLLQKRRSALWDGYWDITGATHPLHLGERDESYEEATTRCLSVEWGLQLPLRNAFSFHYFAPFGAACENEHCAVLTACYSGTAHFNDAYAYDARWLDPARCLAEMHRIPDAFTPWAHLAIEGLVKRRMATNGGVHARAR